MRKRSPFSLYRRGRGGIWHARFWDEEQHCYAVTKSTKCTNRDQAAIAAAKLIEQGAVKPRSADPGDRLLPGLLANLPEEHHGEAQETWICSPELQPENAFDPEGRAGGVLA